MISAGPLSRTEAGTRTALSRVTLVGVRRRVDLVLPSQEPIGVLLPEIMRLLDDRVGTRPQSVHLVTPVGAALPDDGTLESAGVTDGAVLRLVRVDESPSAPVVHDVSDEASDDLDLRAWRWRPGVRRIVAAGISVASAVGAGVLARQQFGTAPAGTGLLAAAVLCALAGVLCGRSGRRALAATLLATFGGLAVLGAWSLADAQDWSGALRLAAVVGATATALLLAGRFTPLGRGGFIGAVTLLGALLLWEAALLLQGGAADATQQARAGALLAVVFAIGLGVLPRLALTASGLAGLDDRRTGGVSVSRYEVGTALAATHRGLALATVVLAASLAATGVLVLRAPSVWTVLLAVAVAVVAALRSRAFPLTAEVVALLAAAAIVTVRLVLVWCGHGEPAGPVAVMALAAAAPLLALAVEPAEHVRVRLRRAGDLLESAAVIALLPLAIGAFGVYGRLLGTFA